MVSIGLARLDQNSSDTINRKEMIGGINHVTIVVRDKNEAENFYFNVLGLEKLCIGKLLWVKVGNQYIHINENPNVRTTKSFHHFAIEVEDLKSYLGNLMDKGIEVFDLGDNLEKININSDLGKDNRNYFIEDPSGNILEFIDSSNQFFKQE